MSPSPVLLCACACARVVPAEVTEAVRRALHQANQPVFEVPDLCALVARRDPSLRRVAEIGPVRIAACYPRAVQWLFAAAGAPLPMAQTRILNMRVQGAEEIIAALVAPETAGTNTEPGQGTGGSKQEITVPALAEAPPATAKAGPDASAWQPWFPVIDFERCTQCLQCLSFCLFGVYGVDAQRRIQVQHPESCKTNCPACSRVCPETAIIFPQYKNGPINGAPILSPDLPGEKVKVDISTLLGGDVYARLRERGERARTRFSKERDPQTALRERQKYLAKLVELGDIPPEVLRDLPPAEEMQRRAEQARAIAQSALGEKHSAP